jgi:dipeptidyl aminopeptidase/acylaminoacyl peptidase
MVEALESAGKDVRYTELPGVGHGAYRQALETPGLVDWLFGNSR